MGWALLGVLLLSGCVRLIGHGVAESGAPDQGVAERGAPDQGVADRASNAQPPRLRNVVAVGSDEATTPPGLADLRVLAGNPVYIKWQASDDAPLPLSLRSRHEQRNGLPLAGSEGALQPGLLLFSPIRKSLIFGYQQDGVEGVAELTSP